jgi:hypothetical protein
MRVTAGELLETMIAAINVGIADIMAAIVGKIEAKYCGKTT